MLVLIRVAGGFSSKMRPSPSLALDEPVARAHRPDFDDLASIPARKVVASPARDDQIGALISLAKELIPPLAASESAVRRVSRHNPDSVWAVERRGRPVGVFAMLLLNELGVEALRGAYFDAAEPPDRELAGQGEEVAAIYLWAIATPGFAVEAFRTVSRWAGRPAQAAADVFTRPVTRAGTRFALRIGFRPLPDSGLYRFRRHRNRANFADSSAEEGRQQWETSQSTRANGRAGAVQALGVERARHM